ncbi:hypothetical protein KPG71_08310 [Roseovarius sp. PS-C2]|uniref:hypothetical protein n=1 Tax=Roseovarius sp. PS-C2 TaxID=2820814 RepID=UPI001C0B5C90|nr:hypothetical protein [Roseovarius sp. PS-C2]MBU3259992.1 hypothetical protein [Roseovarius sp. PS-C2]MBU3260010.1 hypothetical protein [Roseovarius sp. PS-C2]
MISLGSVSKRTKTLYERFYADREAQRFSTLYQVFEKLASYVEASNLGARLEVDYMCLAEIVRSYFLDTIRYKEYHFDAKDLKSISNEALAQEVAATLQRFGVDSIDKLDPLSPEWTELVHNSVNINASKVAAYTAKWILKYKPISVIMVSGEQGVKASLPQVVKPHPFLTNINEEFALHCALLVLGIKAEQVPQKKIDELIYCFRFRDFDELSYFMILSEDYLVQDEEC